jgi:threonylcarbamoyladenosine tRNA methylthiotransferase MtaB
MIETDLDAYRGRETRPSREPRNKVVMREPLVITLGCRLNAYESEVMRRHASDAGLEDCVIVNTCGVTGEAVSQSRQTIRKLRRERPDARIIVTGCAAQIDPGQFAEMPEVDHVIGNAEKIEPATYHGLAADAGFERVAVNDIMSVKETALHMMDGFGTRARAYVQIQNGCDHRCTFCIIPFGRGPSRSVPAGEVVVEVSRLVEAGCGEVVLTGVDITSYGADLPGTMSLGRLIKQVLKHVPELQRLRLSSIDQVEVDPHLIDAIASEERLMPHLHLSVQAGDDMILKRMKRRHLRADAIKFCTEARRLRPDVVFGADLIAGFPTETEDMFENTLRLVDECGLTYLHVFPFSPRQGTPAARMPQVAHTAIKERAQRLRAKGCETQAGFLERLKGKKIEILMEGKNLGRTPHFAEVHVEASSPVGSFKWALLGNHDGRRVDGMLVA